MLNKRLEDMTKDEILNIMFKKLRENPPKKVQVDEDGAILLDKNDPNDVEWFENDKGYDCV